MYNNKTCRILVLFLVIVVMLSIQTAYSAGKKTPTSAISISSQNSYYFQNAQGKQTIFVGDYTWGTFSDLDFDYTSMFDSLKKRGLNIARVWLWWGCEEFPQPADFLNPSHTLHIEPFIREGSALANDGKPKYNLDKFNSAFFSRLDKLCKTAQKRGITLQLIMMDAWMIKHSYLYRLHAFNRDNNINGVDADPNRTTAGTDGNQGFCSMGNTQVMKYQKAYIRKVIDTVNRFDNIYYEIANENYYNEEWELTLCKFIKECEKTMPRQHMTIRLDFPSHSYVVQDWDSDIVHREIMNKRTLKVPLLFDTDWMIHDNDDDIRKTAWTAIASGGHFSYMDDSMEFRTKRVEDKRANLHRQIDYLARFVKSLKPWEMAPDDSLVKSGKVYVLANKSVMFAYLPAGGSAEIDMSGMNVRSRAKWYNPRTGESMPEFTISGGANVQITAPDTKDWALLIKF